MIHLKKLFPVVVISLILLTTCVITCQQNNAKKTQKPQQTQQTNKNADLKGEGVKVPLFDFKNPLTYPSLVLTPQCQKTYFEEKNFLDAQCFKITLSKLLGLTIVFGSVVLKVPQIMKIVKGSSCEGTIWIMMMGWGEVSYILFKILLVFLRSQKINLKRI